MSTIQKATVPGTACTIEIWRDPDRIALVVTRKANGEDTARVGTNQEFRTTLGSETLARQRANYYWRDSVERRSQYDASRAAITEQTYGRPAPVEITAGFWQLGDDIYRVVPSQSSGYLYASRLVAPEQPGLGASWNYAPGAMRTLADRGAQPLSLEAAAAFGKLFGACAICGRTLTNPESIERGIGPICAGKQGW